MLVTSLVISININAQDADNLKYKPWTFNVNMGQTLFWGDNNNDILNPFSAYFKSDKSAFGYGLIIQKNFNPWLGVDFQYLGGQLNGTRYTWSDGNAANLYFHSKINQFGLNLNIDVLDIFREPSIINLFNFYVRGGAAYNLYNATEYSLITNAVTNTKKSGAIEAVGGWGIRFDVNEKLGFTFENTFNYAFDDFLDAHSTINSQANDLFAYTSIGAVYRVYPQPKKPSLEKENEIIPTDSSIATNNNEQPKAELGVDLMMPASMEISDSVIVNIKVSKYALNEKAKLQQTIPTGFIVAQKENATSTFNFADQIITFTWDNFPSQQEFIQLSYYLISSKSVSGSYSIPGIIFYDENGTEKIQQFKESINVTAPAVIAEVPKVETPIVESPVVNETKTSGSVDGLVYRVQVKAIYGGKSTTKSISRQYGIDKEINEEFINGYSKYTAGNFSTYQEAKAYKDQLRQGKASDAFVVAYVNNNRVANIQDALKMEGTSEAKTSVPSTVISSKGISYSIQIAASAKDLSPISIGNQLSISDKVIKTSHNGLYKYLVGSFNSYDDAKSKMAQLQEKVSDAFIVKYVNGIRK